MLKISEAAKFLVVGWVKNWSMRTLLEAIGEAATDGAEEVEALVESVSKGIQFMPAHRHWYISNKGAGLPVQQFVAQSFPRLQSALFAASTNEQRLRLTPQIERLRATNALAGSKYSADERKERNRARRQEEAQALGYLASRRAQISNQRSAWNVCKA